MSAAVASHLERFLDRPHPNYVDVYAAVGRTLPSIAFLEAHILGSKEKTTSAENSPEDTGWMGGRLKVPSSGQNLGCLPVASPGVHQFGHAGTTLSFVWSSQDIKSLP